MLNINIIPENIKKYENLEGNIQKLNNILKHYSNKIHFEDNDFKILNDYNDFILNDEIYVIDIYNELGLYYNNKGDKLGRCHSCSIRIKNSFIYKSFFKH